MDKYIQVLVLVLRAVTVVGIAKISWCTVFFLFVKNASFLVKKTAKQLKMLSKIVQNGGSPASAGCV